MSCPQNKMSVFIYVGLSGKKAFLVLEPTPNFSDMGPWGLQAWGGGGGAAELSQQVLPALFGGGKPWLPPWHSRAPRDHTWTAQRGTKLIMGPVNSLDWDQNVLEARTPAGFNSVGYTADYFQQLCKFIYIYSKGLFYGCPLCHSWRNVS